MERKSKRSYRVKYKVQSNQLDEVITEKNSDMSNGIMKV